MTQRLRQNSPPLVTIVTDDMIALISSHQEPLAEEYLEKIANQPYVSMFDRIIAHRSLYTFDLLPWRVEDNPYSGWVHPQRGWELMISTVKNPHPIAFEIGTIKLTDGRWFTEEELNGETDHVPVVISAILAEINGLFINSIFETHNMIPTMLHGQTIYDPPFAEDFYTFKVVGIFYQPIQELDLTNLSAASAVFEQNNRIYLPLYYSLQIEEFVIKNRMKELYQSQGGEWELPENLFQYPRENVFLLHDWNDYQAFVDFVNATIPEGFAILDSTTNYLPLLLASDNLEWLGTLILRYTILGSIFLYFLILRLMVHERKYEFGAYLALGEPKRNVFFQVLSEILPLFLIAMTLAITLSQHLSLHFSHYFLSNGIAAYYDRPVFSPTHRNPLIGLGLGTPFIDQAPDALRGVFSLELSGFAILFFYLIGCVIIGISVALGFLPFRKASPKEMLLGIK